MVGYQRFLINVASDLGWVLAFSFRETFHAGLACLQDKRRRSVSVVLGLLLILGCLCFLVLG